MKELWRPVQDYEHLYEVSNIGRLRRINGKIQKIQKTVFGYGRVTLYNKGPYKKIHIHRVVAKAFIENPNNKPEVNHIDGNKLNNVVTNLEWVTKSENRKHAFKIGLQKGKAGRLNPMAKKVINTNTGQIWECASECAKENNINYSTLRNRLNGCHYNRTNFKYLTKN